MRVVVLQGCFGVFSTENLFLSMPAIQTCIGLYAEDIVAKKIICAHFDTDIMLSENISRMMCEFLIEGMESKRVSVYIFGGDGVLSLLRLSPPSKYIGDKIYSIFKRLGFQSVKYTRNISNLTPKTFDFTYENGCCSVRRNKGNSNIDLSFVIPEVEGFFLSRVQKSPQCYTDYEALMKSITHCKHY